jgi:DNA-binding transcriptional MerR regulator
MAAGLTVGDFSRATHLSVKTLRHYHQVGLLEPATVNPDTGYRYYSAGQIPAAQVIRRLRDLEMPVADVKAVLAAPDAPARNALIAAHLNRLEARPAHLPRRRLPCVRVSPSRRAYLSTAARSASYGIDGRVSLQSRMRLRSANSHVPSILTNVSR